MSISNVTENSILLLIFNATLWANYAQNAASSPEPAIGNALHTADPGETGNASTNEVAYTYAQLDERAPVFAGFPAIPAMLPPSR